MFRAVTWLLLFSFALTARAATLSQKIQFCAEAGDELGLRILTLRASRSKMTLNEWVRIREALHRHPGVGWDVLRNWDKIRVGKASTSLATMDQQIAAADEAMSKGDFKLATTTYEKVAAHLRKNQTAFGQKNFFIYQSLLQSLARSLYGQGHFAEAATVYEWISTIYPFVRQVQFEKMWAALRANNYALTLGAIASQRSSYFSPYLEPESYLVQYYIYRRMCRKADVARAVNEVKNFAALLEQKKFTMEMWARSDLSTQSLLLLTKSSAANCAYVDDSERSSEKASVLQALNKGYMSQLPRIESEIKRVAAYIDLAADASKKDLPSIGVIPQSNQILKSDTEMWPEQDAEDWIDELGHHRFVGKSECG